MERIAARKHFFVVVVDGYLVGQVSLALQKGISSLTPVSLHQRCTAASLPQLLSARHSMIRRCSLAVERADEAMARWIRSEAIRFSRSNVSYPALKQALTAICCPSSSDGWQGWLVGCAGLCAHDSNPPFALCREAKERFLTSRADWKHSLSLFFQLFGIDAEGPAHGVQETPEKS